MNIVNVTLYVFILNLFTKPHLSEYKKKKAHTEFSILQETDI